MTVITPTDSPKSVRNRCVIERFGDVFVFSCCLFNIPVGIRAVVIGLSQISSFFSYFYELSVAKRLVDCIFNYFI